MHLYLRWHGRALRSFFFGHGEAKRARRTLRWQVTQATDHSAKALRQRGPQPPPAQHSATSP
eukprot:5383235-Alexandrium_andersonii.AAC.1